MELLILSGEMSIVHLNIGDETLLSAEGNKQRDPFMYSQDFIPLINALSDDFINQVWYADNATAAACGHLSDVRL